MVSLKSMGALSMHVTQIRPCPDLQRLAHTLNFIHVRTPSEVSLMLRTTELLQLVSGF